MGEISYEYLGFSCSKNDSFGFSAFLLGAMSSVLKICVDLVLQHDTCALFSVVLKGISFYQEVQKDHESVGDQDVNVRDWH